jgi:prenyltransferase beta subunit
LTVASLQSGPAQTASAVLSDPTSAALNWLITHQQSNGSYGSCTEPQTAPAAYALWIRDQESSIVSLSYSWLKNQMDNSTTWFWAGGGCSLAEADAPGEILYSFAKSQNLPLLNLSFVVSKLLSFQQSNGGFKGYLNSANQQVTSTVDTALALLGLTDGKLIPGSNEQSAINYLFSMQNLDGSFNLTDTVKSDALYSLGPEPISITALVTLALRDASLPQNDPHVASAMSYLSGAASMNFSGHVYAAALSTLVFASNCLSSYSSKAVNFIISQQSPDGGFRDVIRFSTGSNALDTGWAAIALQLGVATCFSISGGGGGGSGRIVYL